VWAGQLGASSVSMAAGSGAPPAKPRAPAWAPVFGDHSRTVDLAGVAAHLRGGELNTAARVSIFASQNSPQRLGFQSLRVKIHRRTGTIYRAFCTES
jgi:hypothetical protein